MDALQPVSLHTSGDGLQGKFLVAYEGGGYAFIQCRPDRRDGVVVLTDLGASARETLLEAHSELGDVALSVRPGAPLSAYALPAANLIPEINHGGVFLLALCGAAGLLGAYGLAVSLHPVLAIVAIVGIGALFAVLARKVPVLQQKLEIGGVAKPVAKWLSGDDQTRRGEGIVAEVKSEYGQIASDVVARIEWPALFDPTVPTTLELTRLLTRWDDDRTRLPVDQRLELASRIRVAFDAALGHARRIGMGHIPDTQRGRAQQALAALRLSRSDGATSAERRAALTKANDILRTITLHYLPTPDDVAMLEGGHARPALPGVPKGDG